MKWCIEGGKIFSTCSKAQYMSIIVDKHNRVLGTGYNGVPSGMTHCTDGGCPRAKNNVKSGTPYDYGPGLCYAIHAEANALLHSDRSARTGGTIYINGVPCFGCAKLISTSGLKKVVFLDNSNNRNDYQQSTDILSNSGISIEVIPEDLLKE